MTVTISLSPALIPFNARSVSSAGIGHFKPVRSRFRAAAQSFAVASFMESSIDRLRQSPYVRKEDGLMSES